MAQPLFKLDLLSFRYLLILYIVTINQMTQHLDQNRDYMGLPEQSIIGTQEVILPYHIVKYILRKGSGTVVTPGTTIYCLVNIFLADGTQIVSCKGNKITKYLIGRNRLIKGLELGLKNVKISQKLRLVVSADYAYSQQKDISLIPPLSKLVFEIDVVDFVKIPVEKMGDVELYYEVYYHLQETQRILKKRDQDGGLYHLTMAFRFAKKIKHYKCKIIGKILLKWGNILYHKQDYQNSLLVINRIDKDDDTIQDCFRLQIKLHQALEKKEELERLIQKMYYDHLHDNGIKRICVNYYKQTQNWDKLKQLQGYDFKKDRFTQIKQSERGGMPFRLFY